MKVVEFPKKEAQEKPLALAEAVAVALVSLGVDEVTEGAFLLAVETEEGLRVATNEQIGDSLLTLRLIENAMVRGYLDNMGEN